MKKNMVLIAFIAGLALGIVAALVGPDYIRPYVPFKSGPKDEGVEGRVMAKQLEKDRLLLTVLTSEGASLVTFTEKVPEINLLVNEQDRIRLTLRTYAPFISNPKINRVIKDQAPVAKEKPQPLPPEGPAEQPAIEKPAMKDTGKTAEPVKGTKADQPSGDEKTSGGPSGADEGAPEGGVK